MPSRVLRKPGAPVSKDAVAQQIRRRIVSGEWQRGARVPTRSELKIEFGTTGVTVQRAFDALSQDGFIVADGRRGTFVSHQPPHLTHYALVFSGHPDEDASWPQFWKALCGEARHVEQETERVIPLYYNVNQHHDSADYKKLLREIETHQLAGVIFASTPQLVAHTPLLQPHGVPIVAVMDSKNDLGIPAIGVDYRSFFDRALDHLAKRERKRVAVFAPPRLIELYAEHFRHGVASRKLQTRPYWWQPVNLTTPEMACSYAHLLMNAEQKVRPDALIIANDNLVQHVLAGLREAEVKVPQDIEIVAHCNFPASTPALPLRQLGFDVHEVFQSCLAAIDKQRAGQNAAAFTQIEAVFEDEISAPKKQQ